MKKKTRFIIGGLLAGVLIASAGAAVAWWGLRASQPAETIAEKAAAEKAAAEKYPAKYVSLEKVIVMLRHEVGDPTSHYMAVDLVFKTAEKQEKLTRDHLPLLRSVAVRALSTLTPGKAGAMSVDELAAEVNRAYVESYAAENRDKPFSDVMIGKLIIE